MCRNLWPYVLNDKRLKKRMILYAENLTIHTTITNFSTHYLEMCKVYTDADGITLLCHGCPLVREITH